MVTGALLVRCHEQWQGQRCILINLCQVDEEQRPMSYAQMFRLIPEGGTMFVLNDIFRLVFPGA